MVLHPGRLLPLAACSLDVRDGPGFLLVRMCVPLSKTCCTNTGSFVVYHWGRWVLLYSRHLKKKKSHLWSFLASDPVSQFLELFVSFTRLKSSTTWAFPLVYFCYPCPHPPCFSAVNEHLLSYLCSAIHCERKKRCVRYCNRMDLKSIWEDKAGAHKKSPSIATP